MDPATVQSFVTGSIAMLVGATAFLATRWIKHVDRLQDSMEKLKESILGLSEKFVTQDQHERDMESLRVFGRRLTDHCPVEGCPYEKTNPGVVLTGSGAKVLAPFIEDATRKAREQGKI